MNSNQTAEIEQTPKNIGASLKPGAKGRGRILINREKRETVGDIEVDDPRMTCRNVNVYYDDQQAIINVSLDIGRNEVIAMIGPDTPRPIHVEIPVPSRTAKTMIALWIHTIRS